MADADTNERERHASKALKSAERMPPASMKDPIGPSTLPRTDTSVTFHRDPAPSPDCRSLEAQFRQYRAELTGYCGRLLGSQSEAEDAVQEALLRAWRGYAGLKEHTSLRSWLYTIAANVCFDMLNRRARRPHAVGLGDATSSAAESSIADSIAVNIDPAELTLVHETVRLALLAAIALLPARQRAVLFLCEVLHWKAREAAVLLGASVASVNSALQRARTTLGSSCLSSTTAAFTLCDDSQRELLARYLAAFEAHDIVALTSLIRNDATPRSGRRESRPLPRASCSPHNGWVRASGTSAER